MELNSIATKIIKTRTFLIYQKRRAKLTENVVQGFASAGNVSVKNYQLKAAMKLALEASALNHEFDQEKCQVVD